MSLRGYRETEEAYGAALAQRDAALARVAELEEVIRIMGGMALAGKTEEDFMEIFRRAKKAAGSVPDAVTSGSGGT